MLVTSVERGTAWEAMQEAYIPGMYTRGGIPGGKPGWDIPPPACQGGPLPSMIPSYSPLSRPTVKRVKEAGPGLHS